MSRRTIKKWSSMKPSKKQLKTYKKKHGSSCFLLPRENKYPICHKRSGNVECKGLLAAHNRAALSIYRKLKPKTYSYRKIRHKARKLAKKHKCNWSNTKKK